MKSYVLKVFYKGESVPREIIGGDSAVNLTPLIV